MLSRDHLGGHFAPWNPQQGLELAKSVMAKALDLTIDVAEIAHDPKRISLGPMIGRDLKIKVDGMTDIQREILGHNNSRTREQANQARTITPSIIDQINGNMNIAHELKLNPATLLVAENVDTLISKTNAPFDSVSQIFRFVDGINERVGNLEDTGVHGLSSGRSGRGTRDEGPVVRPAVRTSVQVPVQPRVPIAEPNTADKVTSRRAAPVVPRPVTSSKATASVVTVDAPTDLMGERDSVPIPDPDSFPSLTQAHAKPEVKAKAETKVATESSNRFTTVERKDKGKGKAKAKDITAEITNAWTGNKGVPSRKPSHVPSTVPFPTERTPRIDPTRSNSSSTRVPSRSANVIKRQSRPRLSTCDWVKPAPNVLGWRRSALTSPLGIAKEN